MSFPNTQTKCPITRQEFRENAKPIEVVINGVKILAMPKEFGTGSLGWMLDKVMIPVGDKACKVQVGTLTIVNSKELPKDAAAA